MTQIQIPSGMRDILSDECMIKDRLKSKIMAVYESYGYRQIETPLIEFYSTYQNTFTALKEETLYKFVDESGQLLALRTDMTLPIARVTAGKYASDNLPLRFCYCSNVYKVRQSFAGKRNEVTDCGVELIGLDDSSDVEVLCCALDVMAALGAEKYTLEIGSSELFRLACEKSGIDTEKAAVLADLIDRKEIPALKEYLKTLSLSSEADRFFNALPLLGGKEALENAMKLCFDEELREEISHMIALRDILSELGYGDRVTFDLGKVPHLEYYTGIIFEGYAEGIGTSVLSGGRYDTLLSKLGRDLPAIGFGVKLDYLLDIMSSEKSEITKLYYPKDQIASAMKKARELRKTEPVEMIPREAGEMEVVR